MELGIALFYIIAHKTPASPSPTGVADVLRQVERSRTINPWGWVHEKGAKTRNDDHPPALSLSVSRSITGSRCGGGPPTCPDGAIGAGEAGVGGIGRGGKAGGGTVWFFWGKTADGAIGFFSGGAGGGATERIFGEMIPIGAGVLFGVWVSAARGGGGPDDAVGAGGEGGLGRARAGVLF